MILYIFLFYDLNINYYKYSEKGFFLDKSIFYNKGIIFVNNRFLTIYDLYENKFINFDNKFSFGLELSNLSISPLIGYKKFLSNSKEFYLGGIFNYKRNLFKSDFKFNYELNVLREICENISNFEICLIDTFLLNFSLKSFIFLSSKNTSYIGVISSSFMLPFKSTYLGGGIAFKFLSKGDLIKETSYSNYYAPLNIFFKVCYNNRKNNEAVFLTVIVKDENNEKISCNLKLNDEVYKINGERKIEIIPGRYNLRFYGDIEDFDTSLVILDNLKIEFFLNKKKKDFSFLSLKVFSKDEMIPIDATVEIIGDTLRLKCDKNGVCNLKIIPGFYVLRVSKDGYLTKGVYVDIEPDKNKEKIIFLQKL